MLNVYINYPNNRICFHKGTICTHFIKARKHKRILDITDENKYKVIENLKNNRIKFKSTRDYNDLWLSINLAESTEEENIANTILSLIKDHYKRLTLAIVQRKCGYENPVILNTLGTHIPRLLEKYSNKAILIKDKEHKAQEIINTITTDISAINKLYRFGPDLYFYKKIIACRRKHPSIKYFLDIENNIELIYATLTAWDMNSRGAKLKYYDQFKESILKPLRHLDRLEEILINHGLKAKEEILETLRKIYLELDLMSTSSRLVANSKTLHFLFPDFIIPIDKLNTLSFLYSSNYESVDRFLEIIRFTFELMKKPIDYSKYLDEQWNQTIPKLIDNAIILIVGRSLKYKR